MADVGDMTKTALKTAKKAAPDQAKGPAGLAAAGAALIALPFAAQGIAKLAGGGGDKAAELGNKAKSKATEKAMDVAGVVADEKLKPSMPKALSGILGGDGILGGGDDSDSDDEEGGSGEAYGSGRRMPIQQGVDVAVPIKVAYNQWTQFEDWPTYMHRVDSANQVDDATVSMSTKTWGITKEFEAEIIEQRPDERIEWNVSEGLAHTGVVTFHELAPRLTRIEVTVDVQPDSLLEKMGRGMRFAKRAVRGDLHRFKAYVEIEEEAPEGGWRGTIKDGDVKSKTERKSKSSSSSNGKSSRRSSSRSTNGSDPSSSKSGSRT